MPEGDQAGTKSCKQYLLLDTLAVSIVVFCIVQTFLVVVDLSTDLGLDWTLVHVSSIVVFLMSIGLLIARAALRRSIRRERARQYLVAGLLGLAVSLIEVVLPILVLLSLFFPLFRG